MKTTKLLRSILTCVLLSFAASCTEEEKEPPVDGTVTDENGPITLELADLTATTALFKGSVNLNLYSKYDEVGIIYSLTEDLEIKPLVTNVVPITNIDKNNRFEKTTHELRYNTKYYYSSYTRMNGIYKFGEVQSFTTDDVKIEVFAPTVTSTTATFTGKVTVEEVDLESLYFGVAWSAGNDFKKDVNEEDVELDDDGSFVLTVEGLKMEKEYYYAPYICQSDSKYGDMKTFITTAASMSVSASQITQTSVTFTGKAEKNSADESIEYGILYSTDSKLEIGASGCVRKILTDVMSANGNYSLKVDGLINDTKYYYCWYARQGSDYKYGPLQEFSTTSITVNISVNPITETTATFTGSYTRPDGDDIEVGLLCSSSSASLTYANATKIKLSDENFTHKITGLNYNTSYYYCSYICQNGKYKYGPVESFKTKDVTVDISVNPITETTATFTGSYTRLDGDDIEVGLLCSSSSASLTYTNATKIKLSDENFTHKITGLNYNTSYYYCSYICQNGKYKYGPVESFKTKDVTVEVSASDIKITSVTFRGKAEFIDSDVIEVGILYSTSSSLSATSSRVKKIPVTSLNDGAFSCKAEGLTFSTTYYYCYYACQDGSYVYGNTESFTTLPLSVNVNLSVESVTQATATFKGIVELLEGEVVRVGVLYSTEKTLNYWSAIEQVLTPDSSGAVSVKVEGLKCSTTYNYCYYVSLNGKFTYGPLQTFTTLDFPWDSVEEDLSLDETANCYIVSKAGLYKIKAVKGNSDTPVEYVQAAEVLWESFGTSVATSVGDLIQYVSYKDNYIGFKVNDKFMEGNAVIAARNLNHNDDEFLWSWHIWLTDQPQEHVYNNSIFHNAGTMMDRNLGATSATPGDVGALGLLYQWGRKDPFLGSSSISSSILAKSTITWPSTVSLYDGEIEEYAVIHPTTFIEGSYTWAEEETLWWTTSETTKSIYDPCPVGWRVPDGDAINGVWEWKNADFDDTTYDSTNEGMSFSISSPSTTWYPASGYRNSGGRLCNVGYCGSCWSASPYSNYGYCNAYNLDFDRNGSVSPSSRSDRSYGFAVRCIKE